MQYGSIGWSVGAFLGLAAASPERRVLGLIGDGSFQMAAQELSSLLRHGCRGILVLLNNGGYSIEVMIHDGPYNTIQGWDYARLAEAFQDRAAAAPQVLARTVRTEAELEAALQAAEGFPGLVFLEAVLDRYDCNKALLGWGTAVADFNAG
jgi:indolepyruvate decarboxylase